jgi:hypothetical protein
MALGDTPNQTKKPKDIKAPAINQLRAGGAGGDSTAALGSNNFNVPKPQTVGDLVGSSADNLVPKFPTPNQTVSYQPNAPLPTGPKPPMVEFNTQRIDAVKNEINSGLQSINKLMDTAGTNPKPAGAPTLGNYPTGSNNGMLNKSGQPIAAVSPTPTIPALPTTETINTRGGPVTRPIEADRTATRGSNPGLTTLDRPTLASNINPVTPLTPEPTTSPIALLSANGTPIRAGTVTAAQNTISSTPTPNLGQLGGASYMTNNNGVKTLNVAGGSISSSSPNFGNSSPQRLADLDKTIANNADPERARLRAESAAMADQRYNDAYRGGLTRAEYENPNSANNLRLAMLDSQSRGDMSGFIANKKGWLEQLGNETTKRGQDVTAEGNKLSTQSANAKLGYDISKDERNFGATQTNKQNDQSIEIQKAQSNIDKSINEQYNNPANMATSWSPAQSFEFVASQNGNLGAHLGKIVGPQTAEGMRREPDVNKRAQRLQALGLSPDQVKQLLMSLQQ